VIKTPAADAAVAGELGTFIRNMHLIRRRAASARFCANCGTRVG
jgi:hypothetical protein